jgi:outer membrane protein TolC
VLGVAAPVCAQAVPAPAPGPAASALPRLTLGDALRIAAARQPRLASARASAASVAAQATVARSRLLPQVTLAADLNSSNAPSRVGRTGGTAGAGDSTGGGGTGGGTPGGTAGGAQRGFRTNFSTGANLDQPVFEPRLIAEAGAARAASRAADADADQIALDVAFAVVDAYYQQVRAEQLVGVQEELLQQATRAARDLALREQTGAGRRVDAVRAEAQRALADVALREARAVAQQAAAALVATLGTRDSAYALDARLPAAEPVATSLEELARQADANSPTLRAANAFIDQRRFEVRAARGDLLPSLRLRSGFGYQQSDLNPRAPFTTLGLSLAWPVFTSGGTQALVRAADAELRVAESEAELLRLEVRRRIAAALARQREAARRLGAAEASVLAGREALRIVEGAYREGALLLVEVFTAQADLARAERGRVQALIDARVAEAELSLSVGREPTP